MSAPPVLLHFDEAAVSVAPGQSILEALEAAGHSMPSSCRAGVCQTCTLQVTEGPVPPGAQEGLSPADRARGHVLSCRTRPTTSLTLRRIDDASSRVPAVVRRVEHRGRVVLLWLEVPGLTVDGGQFIHLIREDGLSRAYSVASTSGGLLELHVGLRPHGQMSGTVAQTRAGDRFHVRGPSGQCIYVTEEPDRPLVLAGLGTGLAPLLGVVREALRADHRGDIHLFVGARTPEDLYMADELRHLARQHPRLRVVLNAQRGDAIRPDIQVGPLEGLLQAAELPLKTARVYLCGAPDWVQQRQVQLFLAGASMSRIHVDPFVEAPVPGSMRG
jgi:CDP-4-dehydro-6-deoxyglucose reductase